MFPPDQMTELAKRVVPIMQEFGLSAFVLAGYKDDGQGNVRRVVIANTAGNPAYQDGLRPMARFAFLWGADPIVEQAKPPE